MQRVGIRVCIVLIYAVVGRLITTGSVQSHLSYNIFY